MHGHFVGFVVAQMSYTGVVVDLFNRISNFVAVLPDTVTCVDV